MAQLPSAFNPGAQEGITDYEAVPPGWYNAMVTKSTMKPTKNGNGKYLELEWTIGDGDFAKRKIWQRLNLVNPSADAVEIANKHLASICTAMGVVGPIGDSQELHAKPCQVRVIKTPANAQYPEGNEVKAYKPYTGEAAAPGVSMPVAGAPANPAAAAAAAAAPAAPAPAAPAAPEAPAGEKPTPPWVK